MPSASDYFQFIYVHIGFIAQLMVIIYARSVVEIRNNWALYRCNPPYWVFSENLAQDFNYCVQTSQTNMMGYLLQPMQYMVANLASMGGELGASVNGARMMISNIRNFLTDIVENVFGVFLNMIVQFQKMIISMKDLVGKIVGIVVTLLYVLDGSLKTMNSAWKGPPGQMVKSIGSCFHPETLLTLQSGEKVQMKDIKPGSVLIDGGRVLAVMRIENSKRETYYALPNRVDGSMVWVTGSHFIYSQQQNKWVHVSKHECAQYTGEIGTEVASLITTTHHIPVGEYLFWDWEDDDLYRYSQKEDATDILNKSAFLRSLW